MGNAVQFQPAWLNAAGVAFALGGGLLLWRTFREQAPSEHPNRPLEPTL